MKKLDRRRFRLNFTSGKKIDEPFAWQSSLKLKIIFKLTLILNITKNIKIPKINKYTGKYSEWLNHNNNLFNRINFNKRF